MLRIKLASSTSLHPDQHFWTTQALTAALLLMPTKPKRLPAAQEGKTGGGAGGREAAATSCANPVLSDLSALPWSVPEPWGWECGPRHPPPAKHRQCPGCHTPAPLRSSESSIQLQKKWSWCSCLFINTPGAPALPKQIADGSALLREDGVCPPLWPLRS